MRETNAVGQVLWDQALMTDPETGLLYGTVPRRYTGILKPSRVDIEHREGQDLLCFPRPDGVGHAPWEWGWARQEETKGCLNGFVALAGASDERIWRFASKWGPIYACRTHIGQCFWNPAAPPLRGCRWAEPEPLWLWRAVAQEFHSALNAAARLHHSDPVPESIWKTLVGADAEAVAASALDEQRLWLAGTLNKWGTSFSGGPSLEVQADLSLTIGAGFGFLPAAWAALVQAITHRHDIQTCDGCGKMFTRRRKPQIGRHVYCEGCGKRAANRLWAQDHRSATRFGLLNEEGDKNDGTR